jgi:hypothetical protein
MGAHNESSMVRSREAKRAFPSRRSYGAKRIRARGLSAHVGWCNLWAAVSFTKAVQCGSLAVTSDR